MQEIHSIGTGGGGGGSRFFGGGDRRLRPHQNNHQNNQALKCPRCDSLNTKFCYYNNYNLSQPRHFCKNCRRYWTKGGVLRNVPVGGGCRKSKRSSKPKNSSSSEISALPTTAPTPTPELNHQSNSHTSSESSSLTATAATEALSAPTLLNADSNNNKNYNEESQLLIHANPSKTVMETNALEQGAGDCGIFSEIATFTSLITSSNEPLAFGFGTSNGIPEASSFQWQNQKAMTVTGDQPRHRNEEEMKLPESVGGNGAVGSSLLDQTVDFSALHSKNSNGGFGSLDWHGDGSADHQGLFDLPNTVDQSYWTNNHWSDPDNSNLFHLPRYN